MGGQARRFQRRDKSQLVVEGRTIFQRQLDALAAVTDDVMLVGVDAPPGAIPWCRAIPDGATGLGPLAGLESALREARDTAVIVLACDMPFVTSDLLAFLAARAENADAVVPRTDRGYHPLCAVYLRRCLAPVVRRLQARQLAMLDFLGEIQVDAVGPEALASFGVPERLLANVNTPADLDDLERLPSHKQ